MLVEPIVSTVAKSYQLYLREDLAQELRLSCHNKFTDVYSNFKLGEVNNWITFITTNLHNTAKDYCSKQKRIESKLVRIDDIQIELVVFPKTYEKSKLIAKIRKGVEAFYINRYKNAAYAKRASRFAYAILNGQRPVFMTNNLQKFFKGNRHNAQQAYTTALAVIRMLLEAHKEEVQCLLEA